MLFIAVARQNVYDDPKFFAAYRDLRDKGVGLHETVLANALAHLLPDLGGRRVVDLGCGDGFLCRLARRLGAAEVVGIDPSERMLALAVERTDDLQITYLRAFAEDAERPDLSADVVGSVLALHYVEDFARVVEKVARWLVPGGIFVFVVEHPVATAPKPRDGFLLAHGIEVAWPLNHYFDEGAREQEWFVPGVVKYHRPLATILNTCLDAGFSIERLAEPAPAPEMVARDPRSRGDVIRPSVLGVRARRG
jgi:SAM-dependent methyltransferase